MKTHRKIFDIVNDIPLNKKFFFIYILCVLIPIVVTNLFFFNTVGTYVTDREMENRKISLNRAANEIEDLLRVGIDICQAVSMDRTLYELLDKNYPADIDYYSSFNDFLRDRINIYMIIYRSTKNIEIFTSNPRIINGGNYFYIDEEIAQAKWYKKIDQSNEDILIYPYKYSDPKNPKRIIPSISILKKLNRYVVYSRNKSIIRLDINVDSIYEVMNREKSYMDLVLVDHLDRVICSTDKRYESNINGYKRFEDIAVDKFQLLVTDRFEHDVLQGWKLVGILDNSALTRELNAARSYVLMLMTITTLVSTFLVVILLRSYNYRVVSLTKHMRKVKEQQFDHIMPIQISEGKDEIGEIIRSFNLMAGRINALIHDVYKLELQKKDLHLERMHAELKFLQSQMNPHFLFNTLNAILIVCVRNNYTNVIEIIKYLSKILRRLLSWEEDIISIAEEISFTEMYLKIEKFRFGDQFNYTFSVDERAMQYKIPKMSIQTIVENACKHGLQTVKGNRMVAVAVQIEKEYLIIAVKDNGKGIESDTLHDIIEDIKDENAKKNIGIRNVYRRLKLNYGEEVEFTIKSEFNKGTEVYFKIPIIENAI